MKNLQYVNSESVEAACKEYKAIRLTVKRAEKYGLKVIHHMVAVGRYGNARQHILYVRFPDHNTRRFTHTELQSVLSDYAANEMYCKGKQPVKTYKPVENPNGEKKEYVIPVTRIGYSYKTIHVIATSQEEAEQIALSQAGDYEFSERDADYKIVY